jgi:hypothetical protein
MLRSKIIYVLLIVCCLLISSTARADSGCAIVYGQNWAFLFTAPAKWEVACPVKDQSGVIVALWPEGTPWAKSPGVMYVTVSKKNGFSLEQFAEDELERFRVESPGLQVQVIEPISLQNKSQTLVRKLSGDQYGNYEIIAYAEAGSTYLIFVLTSRTQKIIDSYLPSFRELVSSVSPMQIKFEGAAP